MHGYLPYEITKSVETVISDPELAKKVIEAIEYTAPKKVGHVLKVELGVE